MVNHFNQMFDTWPVTWLWPFRSCPRACCPYWSARSAWRPSPSRPFPAAVTGTLSARSAGPGHTSVQSAGRTFTPPQSASPRRPTVCWRSSPASPAPTSTSAAPSAPPCSPSRLTSWPVRTTHTSLNRSIWPPQKFFFKRKIVHISKNILLYRHNLAARNLTAVSDVNPRSWEWSRNLVSVVGKISVGNTSWGELWSYIYYM